MAMAVIPSGSKVIFKLGLIVFFTAEAGTEENNQRVGVKSPEGDV